MALREYRPTSPGMRQLIQVDRNQLWKGEPEKVLTEGKKKTGGRNNHGRLTSGNKGGGHKKRYRIIDWKRDKKDIEGKIVRLEYDPNRTAWIALIEYKDGEKRYILAPQRVKAGDKIVSGNAVDIKPGNAMKLRFIPVGTFIHNIELKPGKGAQMARSPPVHSPSWLAATATTPSSSSLRAKFASCMQIAWPRSARFRTQTT
jgi:large subunit ribosomal protein L2